MLSRKSIDQLTQKIEDEVANYVTEDPRFTELLNELVPEAIDITLGNIDDRSAINLVTHIASKLRCSPNHSKIHYPRCPL